MRKEGKFPLLIFDRHREQDDAILVYQKPEDLSKLMEDLQSRYAANRRPYRVIGDIPDSIVAILACANLQLIFEDKIQSVVEHAQSYGTSEIVNVEMKEVPESEI